ncbi:uncharacterized protein EURHEDRAFT_309656 [Aspergillus ruber CBS 135680]|uniref:Uncharacterized protein n=1 Tax=Aspergillus ruber (strain CBS 135680) TaxID=1388766 RepID=A0A017RZZ3_ASPRC|nr:uncharacterized protein EURHEDRAFT_309656 [Aspergillus ruber CBS 135680]EYE90358.1 hypothetical protein EURHEDRAFT_309656 [Aspergillus ruber CBS 135680]
MYIARHIVLILSFPFCIFVTVPCLGIWFVPSSMGPWGHAIGLPWTGRCSWRGCTVLVLRAGNELFLLLNVDRYARSIIGRTQAVYYYHDTTIPARVESR